MAAAVPLVEVADDADVLGIRRPHREAHTLYVAEPHGMGAEQFIGAVVPALAEQLQVEIPQRRPKAQRVAVRARCAPPGGHGETAGTRPCRRPCRARAGTAWRRLVSPPAYASFIPRPPSFRSQSRYRYMIRAVAAAAAFVGSCRSSAAWAGALSMATNVVERGSVGGVHAEGLGASRPAEAQFDPGRGNDGEVDSTWPARALCRPSSRRPITAMPSSAVTGFGPTPRMASRTAL
jgi:hypothetical protein